MQGRFISIIYEKIYDSSSPSIVNNRFIFRDRFECIDGAVDCFDSASPLIKGNSVFGIVLYNDLLPNDNDPVFSNNDFSRTP